MNEFFANIWNVIESLAWSDWMTLIILLIFLILGFKRGMAKEIINLGFLLLVIIIAWLFYQPLASSDAITWLLLSHQSHMATAFGAIFMSVLIIKRIIYRLVASSSNINNPCTLNKIFAYLIFFIVALVLSWNYLHLIEHIGLMEIVVTNTSLRIGLSFVITFAIIIGLFLLISSILNIDIDASKACFLSSFFKKILNILRWLDEKLNARNINSNKNNFGGILVGLIKGSLAILIMVLVFQSIDSISQKSYWAQANGALKTFQDVATDIRPTLSEHLLFIKNE
ncbi:CvpA family protein [Candidatus Thioglobus sp.]|uniref:CvpA family protein n=1 Tax=Candidatus Thioglobus sp. TaxID=2026721 RepID=UPI003D126EAA